VQAVTTVLKFVPLAIVALVGLFFIHGGNYTPFAPHGTWKAISAAAPPTLWAFNGLESATVAAEEVKDPERNSWA
jgi:basic amino acid/polyamine antiporter, APA family